MPPLSKNRAPPYSQWPLCPLHTYVYYLFSSFMTPICSEHCPRQMCIRCLDRSLFVTNSNSMKFNSSRGATKCMIWLHYNVWSSGIGLYTSLGFSIWREGESFWSSYNSYRKSINNAISNDKELVSQVLSSQSQQSSTETAGKIQIYIYIYMIARDCSISKINAVPGCCIHWYQGHFRRASHPNH